MKQTITHVFEHTPDTYLVLYDIDNLGLHDFCWDVVPKDEIMRQLTADCNEMSESVRKQFSLAFNNIQLYEQRFSDKKPLCYDDNFVDAIEALVIKTRAALRNGDYPVMGRLVMNLGLSDYSLSILSNSHASRNPVEDAKYLEIALMKDGELIEDEYGEVDTYIFNGIDYRKFASYCTVWQSEKNRQLGSLIERLMILGGYDAEYAHKWVSESCPLAKVC